MQIQYYEDSDKSITVYWDLHETVGSKKCKPEHIHIMDGDASPIDIANDINRQAAAQGKTEYATARRVGGAK